MAVSIGLRASVGERAVVASKPVNQAAIGGVACAAPESPHTRASRGSG